MALRFYEGGLLHQLNQILNKNHNWFDYGTEDELMEKKYRWYGFHAASGKDHEGNPISESPYGDPNPSGLGSTLDGIGQSISSIFGNLPELINSLVAYYGRTTLTGAENEQNAFNAAEAEKSRQFTEYMARNKYSMETGSMQDAGVNPAMVYGGGNLVPTASNGATGTGSLGAGGSFFDMLTTMMRLPLEMKNLKAEADRTEAEAELARQKKITEEAESRIRAINADYQEQLNGQTLNNLKADYNNKVADTDYKTAQRDYVITQKDAQATLNKYLDERQQEEIRNLKQSTDKMSAEEKKTKAEKVYQDWYNGFVQKNGFLPSSNDMLMLGTYVASLFGIVKEDISSFLDNIVEEVGAFIQGKPRNERGKGGDTSKEGGNNASGSAEGGGSR